WPKQVGWQGIVNDSNLVVNCETINVQAREYFQLRAARNVETWESTIRQKCTGLLDESLIQLRTENESLTVRYPAFRAWFADYYMIRSLSYIGPRAQVPPGVCLALEIDTKDNPMIKMIR